MYEAELATIAANYGLGEQLVQTAEECSELAQSALKYRRVTQEMQSGEFDSDEFVRAATNLAEEIADVNIMTAQIIMLLGVDKEVADITEAKISRQLERIEQEHKNLTRTRIWKNLDCLER